MKDENKYLKALFVIELVKTIIVSIAAMIFASMAFSGGFDGAIGGAVLVFLVPSLIIQIIMTIISKKANRNCLKALVIISVLAAVTVFITSVNRILEYFAIDWIRDIYLYSIPYFNLYTCSATFINVIAISLPLAEIFLAIKAINKKSN